MTIDKNIIETLKEKVEEYSSIMQNESNESSDISKILVEWIKEIDEGKKDIPTEKIISSLVDIIKFKWVK